MFRPNVALVKRVALALAAACVLVLGVVAAPALSLKPYRAEPVDFQLALGGGGGPAVSKPVQAPKRFNLVGMRWEGRAEPGIAVRTRRDGEHWSAWTPLRAHPEHAPDPGRGESRSRGASEPLWVGEADWVQYRMSRRPRGLRLHFVNVQGTATAADRTRTAIRRAGNAAVIALGGVATARAQGAPPAMVSREAWGADACPPRAAPEEGEVKAAVVHHTVTANDYSPEEGPDIVLGICRFHRNSNGWNDIGYNFLVDKYGVLYEGRAGGVDQAIVGAQAQGFNAQTTGIANLGTFTSARQTAAALDAMARLIRWKLPVHGAPTYGFTTLESAGGSANKYPAGESVRLRRIIGHRDTGNTACPGSALYAQLPELRRLVGNVNPAGTATRLSGKPRRMRVRFGTRVSFSGRLRGGGVPLPRAQVEVQRRAGRSWRSVGRATTDASGLYTVVLKPQRNRRVRARFAGAGDFLPSSSKSVVVGVRPRITLLDPPRRGTRGVRLPIEGRVKPFKRRLYLVVQIRRRGRNKKLGVRRVRPERDGSFRTYFTPGRTGRFRIYVVAKSDRSTVRSPSRPQIVNIARARGGTTPAP